MPLVLADDGVTATVQTDEGTTYRIPSAMAKERGLSLGAPGGGVGAGVPQIGTVSLPSPYQGLNEQQPLAPNPIVTIPPVGLEPTAGAPVSGQQRLGMDRVRQLSDRGQDVALGRASTLQDQRNQRAIQGFAARKRKDTSAEDAGGSGAPQTEQSAPETVAEEEVQGHGPAPGTQSTASTGSGNYGGSVNSAISQQQDAIRQGQQRGEALAAKESAYWDEFAKQREAAEALQKQEEERRKAEGDKVKLEIIKRENAYANGEIDPNRIWKGRDGARVAAAIAVAMGAFGAAMTGSQNYALQIVDSAIDRDIDAQKAELAKKGKMVDFARNRYAELLNQHGNERTAEAALRSEMYAAAEIQAKKFAIAKNTNAEKTQSDLVIGQLQEKKALNTQAAAAAAEEKAALRQLSSGNTRDVNFEALPKEVRERYIHELKMVAATPKDRDEIIKALDTKNRIVPLVDQMLKMRREHGRESGITGESAGLKAEAESLSEDLLLEVKNLAELGVLSKDDAAIVRGMVGGNPLSVKSRDITVLRRLEKFRDRVEGKTNAFIKTRGLRPVERVQAGTAVGAGS